jgi:hypothetical protein
MASKFEGVLLKADEGTAQGLLKTSSLRHGVARATVGRRSERRDRASITNCTGNQRKDSRWPGEVKGMCVEGGGVVHGQVL